MVTALDVANFFIVHCKDTEDPMTNARVNKYVYFAQGYSLGRTGKPLFEDKIEAWDMGPVIPDLYDRFKTHKNYPLTDIEGEYNPEAFTKDELQILIDVMIDFRNMSTEAVIDKTHEDGTPWRDVYNKGHNNPIDNLMMKEFFSKEMDQRSFIQRYLDSTEYVGRHDENGHLILPEEYR